VSERREVRFTRQARKDVDALAPCLRKKLRAILLEVIAENPHRGKRLVGDLTGSFWYVLSHNDRIVYSSDEDRRIVYIDLARTHCGH
jgi:mRNA-degrading endonuclease RelE of RelBE toxin-antitoxin system